MSELRARTRGPEPGVAGGPSALGGGGVVRTGAASSCSLLAVLSVSAVFHKPKPKPKRSTRQMMNMCILTIKIYGNSHFRLPAPSPFFELDPGGRGPGPAHRAAARASLASAHGVAGVMAGGGSGRIAIRGGALRAARPCDASLR